MNKKFTHLIVCADTDDFFWGGGCLPREEGQMSCFFPVILQYKLNKH